MIVVDFIKNAIDFLSAPQYLVTGALIGLVLAIHWGALWTTKGGLALLVLVAGGIGLSYLDPNFNKVATLPDNVPIVGMIFLVGFFFWFSMTPGLRERPAHRRSAGRRSRARTRRRRSSRGPTSCTSS